MRSLLGITVGFSPGDGDHINIDANGDVIYAMDDPAAFGYPSADDLADARCHLAGVLGRVAVEAIGLVEIERQIHGCDQPYRGCRDDDGDWQAWLPVTDWSHVADSISTPYPPGRPRRYDCCSLNGELLATSSVDVPWIGLYVPVSRRDVWLARLETWLHVAADEDAATPDVASA